MIIQIETNFPPSTRVEFNNKIGKDDGIVTAIVKDISDTLIYEVMWSDKVVRRHYDFELKLKE